MLVHKPGNFLPAVIRVVLSDKRSALSNKSSQVSTPLLWPRMGPILTGKSCRPRHFVQLVRTAASRRADGVMLNRPVSVFRVQFDVRQIAIHSLSNSRA